MRIGLDITVLAEKNKTGVGVYTYNLIDNLIRLHPKEKFILFGFSTFKTFDYLNNLKLKNYKNVEYKVIKIPAKLSRLLFICWQKIQWPKVENLIGPIDIYHSFNFYVPPQKSGKTITTVYDLTPVLYPSWHHKRTVQMENIRLKNISKYSDSVITISENSKKDLENYDKNLNIKVIYPGVGKETRNKKASDKVLEKYDLKAGYILSVSTIEPRKNLIGLINAYLKTNISDPLVLAGGVGWEDKEINLKIEENKDRVIRLGFVPDEDMEQIYKNAKCLVYPSFYEGFGLPVLEAMAMGTPVICSNNSSIPEVGGNAVIYIDPNEVDSIKKALIEINKNDKLKKDLRRKGIIQSKKFSWEKSAKDLMKIYYELN